MGPVKYLAESLQKEFANRNIRAVFCNSSSEHVIPIKLHVKEFSVINRKLMAFTPWESYHQFYAELETVDGTHPIFAYFYNGKMVRASVKEVAEPCFILPSLFFINEIASKINVRLFNLSLDSTATSRLYQKILAHSGSTSSDSITICDMAKLCGANSDLSRRFLKELSSAGDMVMRACALSGIGIRGNDGDFGFLKSKYKELQGMDKTMAMKSIGDLGKVSLLRDARKSSIYQSEPSFMYCVELYLQHLVHK
ncbi:MAG: hypothetical protein JW913_00225 [Chitinispirillaceae bacterium]|nr:hypothetical protein [Chitinispirillaceae bacterium]